MIEILATILCVVIVLFGIVCLVAWFAYRNQPINLGGKKVNKYISSLEELKPFMITTYGFTRGCVARALVKHDEMVSSSPCIMSDWHLNYAGRLIAKAKRSGEIISTFRTNGRYYKFTNREKL
jgi:hypothetical protein